MNRHLDESVHAKLEALFHGDFVPRSLYFDTTNVCNANCIFCGYGENRQKGKHLPQEVFERAVNSYVDMGGSAIGLTPIIGDPLVDPGFLDKIRFCETVPGLKVIRFFTNAIALTPEILAPLFKEARKDYRIFVSLLGFDRQTFKKIARVDRFETVETNLLYLLDYLDDNPGSNIRFVGMPRCFAQNDGSSLFNRIFPYLNKDQVREDGAVIPPPFDSFAGHSDVEKVVEAELQLKEFERKDGPCDILFTKPIVLADGTINGCAERDIRHELTIGNIYENSLQQIFGGDRFRRLVDRFTTNDAMPQCCRDCSAYRSVYNPEAKIWNNIMSWSKEDA